VIKNNIFELRERVLQAAKRAGLDPAGIVIVAVTKTRSAEEIREVIDSGITDIGENRVQEAIVKYQQLLTPNSQLPTLKWHLVGHLQTNKAKDAVKIFDLIHSVDSFRLAEEIDKQAQKINKIQDILVEVKTSEEASKSGVLPSAAPDLIREISLLKNIRLLGLMTIAPLVDDPEKARPYFRKLRELRDQLQTPNSQLRTLSMGMSDDFEAAIEEGANMVRIGRALFD